MDIQKGIRIAGYGLMIFAIFYMVYEMIQDTSGDINYIVVGLLLTVVGMFLAQYGLEKKEK